MDSERKRSLIRLQRMEITEAEVYKKLAKNQRNKNNKTILEQIAEQEINHYNILKNITNIDVKP
ncbi:MAG: rubrerythrin family protein, partial [Euryarchaeota archaeon]|nr:rubrerythrin family protein [Euryarchaeota archaeon]